VNSEDRKGVVARVRSWVQSHWQQPDGSTCHEYLGIAVITLVIAALFAAARANIVLIVGTLVLGWMIAFLLKEIEWSNKKLVDARNVLLDVALQECRGEPESYLCHVCKARRVLEEHFPRELPYEIRAHVLAGGPLSEELASYLTPIDRFHLENELAMGWKVPFYPK
jgi:hypothetical protein